MSRTSALRIEDLFSNKLQVAETVSILILSVLIPFLVHFVPVSGSPAGAVLLPIFIAPFIAVVFFRSSVAMITALFAPVLNYLITGNPVIGIVGLMTVELFLFVLITKALINLKYINYIAAPVSVIISMFAAQLVFSTASHFTTVLTTAIPGIVIIAVLNVLIIALTRKSN